MTCFNVCFTLDVAWKLFSSLWSTTALFFLLITIFLSYGLTSLVIELATVYYSFLLDYLHSSAGISGFLLLRFSSQQSNNSSTCQVCLISCIKTSSVQSPQRFVSWPTTLFYHLSPVFNHNHLFYVNSHLHRYFNIVNNSCQFSLSVSLGKVNFWTRIYLPPVSPYVSLSIYNHCHNIAQ